jgi:DNA-binding transcriptional LysR family regulator
VLPDLDSLRCFHAAARLNSFRAAAAAVALSPSAFSSRIRMLEEQLGNPLFERTTRRVALTPAGNRLLPVAEEALRALERCGEAVRAAHTEEPWSVTVGTRFELGLSWLLPAVQVLASERQERTIHLAFGDGPDLLVRLRRGQIDAVVTSSRIVESDFDYAALHEERYVFVASRATSAALGAAWPDCAIVCTLVDIGPSLPLFRYLLDAAPPEWTWPFRSTEHMGTIAAIRHRLLASTAVAVLPRYFVEPDLHAGALVQLMPKVEPRQDCFRLIWMRNHPRTSELRELAQRLLDFPLQ